ncbi:unnamed protein product [Spirodela intermedia]|uniref:Uncharacterized protein n=1 Tax=Spirodela intermedia TaxID=51605 RepID=A0A7I8JB66_SPIIN|nr:unnamed protein product [Spirodela intermedia]CAA6666722.1 unnamed protein product [Spirodela intermedia]
MDSSSPVASSPSSDHKLWSALRSRVETLLEGRKRHADWSSTPTCGAESRCGKRIREDSLLLIRGLDSVASSLSQLKETLDDASQGVENLVHPSLTDVLRREGQRVDEEKMVTKTASCQSASDDSKENREPSNEEVKNRATAEEEEQKISKEHPVDAAKGGTLKKAKNLAISMLSKATSLARELKAVRSELGFMQERCDLLEEENRRLRYGGEKGPRPDEEDDLVRLQVEALLAEKSRLSNENATLTRENQRLHQLVEYHQLTAQDLTESYSDLIHGVCLDFSSPSAKTAPPPTT